MMNSKFTSHLASLAVAALSGLLLMTACEKEKEDTVNIPEGALRISAESTHGSNGSKTTVDGTAVYWTNGDAINVNGTTATVVVGEDAAYLTGIDNSVPMAAGFPAEIFNISTLSANIPSSYSYDEREGDQKVDLPMVAYAEANSDRLDFKHVCAAIQVNVNNAFNSAEFYLEKITVSSDSKALCGTIRVTSIIPEPSITYPSYSASTASVTMNFGDEEVSVAANSSKSIQIPVLPTDGSSTISVEIKGHYANGADFGSGRIDAAAKIIYINSSATTLARAKVYPAPCTIRVSGSAAVSKTYPKFSVSSTKKVYFSHGNLQYQASSSTWRFASSQNSSILSGNGAISSTTSSWIDLFGWGTSGNSTGATAYQPWSTSTTNSHYYVGGSASNDLTYNNNIADWGDNTISNTRGTWHTLTKDEWGYLLISRGGTYRYAKATVDGKTGLIIFPDSFELPTSISIANRNTASAAYSSNNISSSNWNLLERAGCVFLPTTLLRNGTRTDNTGWGFYWSSTHATSDAANRAFSIYFTQDNLNVECEGQRNYGFAVRLVQDAN